MDLNSIRILDNALRDPLTYLDEVRRLPFRDITLGRDTFRGIALAPHREVDRLAAVQTGGAPVLSFLRRSPAGQVEPNFVHTDEGMGLHTAILYLNPAPPDGDGTDFWDRVGPGATRLHHVAAKFNRLLTFDARLPHSRALFDNYGSGDTARLIQVVFLQ